MLEIYLFITVLVWTLCAYINKGYEDGAHDIAFIICSAMALFGAGLIIF